MSIRGHYVESGADGYYQEQGDQYLNPHEDRVKKLIQCIFGATPPVSSIQGCQSSDKDASLEVDGDDSNDVFVTIVDPADAAGRVTGIPHLHGEYVSPVTPSKSNKTKFKPGDKQLKPSMDPRPNLPADGREMVNFLDLSAGSGEVTLALCETLLANQIALDPNTAHQKLPSKPSGSKSGRHSKDSKKEDPVLDIGGCNVQFYATDPYTSNNFNRRLAHVRVNGMGLHSYSVSFQDIVANADVSPMADHWADSKLDVIVCSYALHLLDEDTLGGFAIGLGLEYCKLGTMFIIITPHKRPTLKRSWGWERRWGLKVDRSKAIGYEYVGLSSE